MVFNINSMGLLGIEAFDVRVETDISKGIPSFDIVGLPDVSVKESRDRVRSSIKNCGFEFPARRLVVNLAPAGIKKIGSVYDLPILVSILQATGAVNKDLSDSLFVGELSLGGEVRPINGVLPMSIYALKRGFKHFFVPKENALEGSVVKGIEVIPVSNVTELVMHLRGERNILPAVPAIPEESESKLPELDFADVRGQYEVKRALEIAAAGGHNVLMAGSPGAGKSMLAKRMPTILPKMTFKEMIETTKIYSIAGMLPKDTTLIVKRPFRSPHHTVSAAGLTGGGTIPRPGEISLAHNGVLFLDELPEFKRSVTEVLRQPIEDSKVTVSRVHATITYPCSIMLIAAMNPCPCGYLGHPTRACTCSSKAVDTYLSRISGPLMDRFDIQIEVQPVDFKNLSSGEKAESSAEIRKRVNAARVIQNERFKKTGITCNAGITSAMINEVCPLDLKAKMILQKAFERLGLSARAYDRILKVSRTIADIDNSEMIKTNHIMEALQYRSLESKYKQRK